MRIGKRIGEPFPQPLQDSIGRLMVEPYAQVQGRGWTPEGVEAGGPELTNRREANLAVRQAGLPANLIDRQAILAEKGELVEAVLDLGLRQ